MTMLHTIADAVVSFCGLPSVNPTVPTAVTSLGVTPRPGAIEFTWPAPTIKPLDTEYRIMQATANSYGAATEVWRGNALGAVLTKPNTASAYYWHDALNSVGSYSTFPGVNSGVVGYALLADTVNIAPNAATLVRFVTNSGGTVVSSHGGGTQYSYPGSLAWTNDTGASVTVQVDASVAAGASTSNTASGKAFAQLQIDTGGTPQGYFVMQSGIAYVGSDAPTVSGAAVQQWTVANSETITAKLRLSAEFAAGLGGVTATWADATLRLSAIKR